MASKPSRVLRSALKKVTGSGNLPGDLSSAEFAQVSRSIRERAVFSAKVSKARILDGIADVTEKVLQKKLSPLDAREKLRAIVEGSKYKPPEGYEGTIQDLSSDQRLDLIVRTNRDMARGYGRFVDAQASLDEFPFWELYRAEPRLEPRDWRSRWAESGGTIQDGKMLAPVNSGIWLRLSAFGNPYPPFDFNSGMSVRRVRRERVEEMGLRIPKQKAKQLPDFSGVEANLPDDRRIASRLLRDLGPGYRISGGKVVRA